MVAMYGYLQRLEVPGLAVSTMVDIFVEMWPLRWEERPVGCEMAEKG